MRPYPRKLDAIACDFPDLAIIGSHIGWPWTHEMVGMATVHPNVYIATDSYAPRYWGEALDSLVRGDGSRKVLFGTMWPSVSWARAIGEIAMKNVPSEAMAAVLGSNAARLYRLRESE